MEKSNAEILSQWAGRSGNPVQESAWRTLRSCNL